MRCQTGGERRRTGDAPRFHSLPAVQETRRPPQDGATHPAGPGSPPSLREPPPWEWPVGAQQISFKWIFLGQVMLNEGLSQARHSGRHACRRIWPPRSVRHHRRADGHSSCHRNRLLDLTGDCEAGAGAPGRIARERSGPKPEGFLIQWKPEGNPLQERSPSRKKSPSWARMPAER
jgi:hypothetical protein